MKRYIVLALFFNPHIQVAHVKAPVTAGQKLVYPVIVRLENQINGLPSPSTATLRRHRDLRICYTNFADYKGNCSAQIAALKKALALERK